MDTWKYIIQQTDSQVTARKSDNKQNDYDEELQTVNF